MLTRSHLVVAFVMLAVLATRAPALAQPEALTKAEIGCQSALNKGLPAYGKARTACVAKCQKKTPLSSECTSPFGGKTLECVQKADTKLAGLIGKKCVSGGNDDDSCPECYEEVSPSCTAFGASVKAKSIALVDDINTTIFCNDTASVDGLTKAEMKCQKALTGGLTKFVSAVSKCETKCLKNERKAKTDATCNPAALLSLGGDSKTAECIFKAVFKLFGAFEKCQDEPECGDFGGLLTDLFDDLAEIGGDVNVCPADCGDGFVQGVEECDPPATQGQCPGNAVCTAQCMCP